MIEPGSPTSGLTNWNNMNVVTMWATIQDQRTDNHWRQVTGWRKTSELALTHLSRLQEYRRGLAQAWPPEKSAASRRYLAELDELIGRVQSTYDAAVANHEALSAATRAIGSTRTELKKLYDQFEEKYRRKLAYEESLQTRPLPRAGRPASVQPPVTDADLERLNAQARTLMYGLSGELQQAQAMLKPPPPPPKIIRADPSVADVYGGGSPPMIPPIVPVALPPSASSRSGDKPSSSTVRTAPTPPSSGVGPVLGGAGPALLPAQANPTMPTVTPSTPSPGPTIGPGIAPPLSPASGPSSRGPLDAAPGRGGGQGGAHGKSHAGGASSPPTGPRPMPPGGLIGGTPGMGLGQPAPGPPSPRRINPIGGVIGGGAAGTAPTGAAGSRPGVGRGPAISGMPGVPFGGAPGYGSPAVRPSLRERNETEERRWDPDNPWETDRGVDPVLRPPDEDGPIDPGPAIGLNQ